MIVYKLGKKEGDLADKIKVKQYVNDLRIKGLKIPKTIKTYKKTKDIDINELPNKFVIKCNHGSGNVFICKDKENFEMERIKKILDKDLKNKFHYKVGEYHYKYIKPQIMIEEYLDDSVNTNPIDYKFYCVKGKVKSILVCTERDVALRLDVFDTKWNHLDDTIPEYQSSKKISKPKNLEKMIEIAEKLSDSIDFVRVDLYEINNKIYFGEYTFTPAAGLITYYTEEALLKHADYIEI